MMKNILFLIIICGCHSYHAGKHEDVTQTQLATYNFIADRAVNKFVDESGFIVGRGADPHLGDSLFFTGLAVYGLDCARGKPLSEALQHMLSVQAGGLSRHPTLKGQITLDGLLAAYRGIAKRVMVCGEKHLWVQPLLDHSRWLTDKRKQLLPFNFDLVFDQLLAKAGGPTVNQAPIKQAALETVVEEWSGGVIATKTACYRVNLGLIALQTLQELGRTVSDGGRDALCTVTEKADIPTLDKFCGRGNLTKWLSLFMLDTWQYRHQRCPAWESPDAKGAEAGVDFLVGYRDLHG